MIIAAPALIEAYAVLTRLPAPHRISPADALRLLEANFLGARKLFALSPPAYRVLLRSAPDGALAGGRVYDAVIAACARKAGVKTLLTFNEAHFASFAAPDLEVIVP